MLALISALAAALAAAVQAPQPGPLAPTEKWVVNFADAQCLATRNYGSAADPLILAIKAPPLGDVLQFVIVQPGAADPDQVPGVVIIDGRPPIRTTLFEYGVASTRRKALLVNVPRSAIEPLRSATQIQIRVHEPGEQVPASRMRAGGTHIDVRFALTQMGPLLRTMDECVADLKEVWKITDESVIVTTGQTAGPSGSLASVFTSDDYPAEALLKDQTGSVRFALLVDETGRIADCTIIETSGVASLDAQSCAIARDRARFTPGRDADGKPSKGAFLQRVTWKIQG